MVLQHSLRLAQVGRREVLLEAAQTGEAAVALADASGIHSHLDQHLVMAKGVAVELMVVMAAAAAVAVATLEEVEVAAVLVLAALREMGLQVVLAPRTSTHQ